VLTSFKIIVGLSTHSLGILAEAAHSGLDMVRRGYHALGRPHFRPARRPANTPTGTANSKISRHWPKPSCSWLPVFGSFYEAVKRLFFREVHVDLNTWAFVVVFVSIIIDISRSRALKRAADKYSSQALEADALHFSTDVWSSLVVFLGLSAYGRAINSTYHGSSRPNALAALGVAAIVVWVSLQLGKKTVADLLDSVPKGMQEQVEAARSTSAPAWPRSARFVCAAAGRKSSPT